MDPFKLKQANEPAEDEVDIVASLEKELRSEKKAEVNTTQSQCVGSSGIELPDAPGQNEYLKAKAEKYAMQDDVKPGTGTTSILGDFNFLLDMQSMAAEQNSGLARSQSMAMAYSTMQNTDSSAQKIIESQMAYNLSASSFGLQDKERKSFKSAMKKSKFGNNTMYR